MTERWRGQCKAVRPHNALGYRPPAPEGVQPWPTGSAPTLRLPAVAGLSALRYSVGSMKWGGRRTLGRA